MRPNVVFHARALGRYVTYQMSAMVGEPMLGPRSAVLSVIPGCNSKCHYCPIHLDNRSPHPSKEELLDAITQLDDLGVRKLTLSGGEPMLRDDVPEIVRHAASRDMTVNVLTNGLLLTQAILDQIINAGAWSIVLSLDTLDEGKYQRLRGVTIRKIDRALNLLATAARANRIKVALTCVVTMLNLDDLPSVATYAQEHWMAVSYQPYNLIRGFERYELLPTAETLPILEAAIEALIRLKGQRAPILNSESFLRAIPTFMFDRKKMLIGRCLAGYTGINVDAYLNVLPCWNLPAVGNLRRQSLRELWESEKYKTTRRNMRELKCPGCMLLCHHEYQYG